MKKVNILGINVDLIAKKQTLKKIKNFLTSSKQHYITTPNAEMILKAQTDEELFYILNNSDLAIPDAVSLKFAGFCLFENIKRFPGADMVRDILKIAEKENKKVAIVNLKGGLSSEKDIREMMKKKYPKINFIVEDVEKDLGRNYKNFLNLARQHKPEILFVTLGCPMQEKFIYHNIKNISSVKLAIGVGGSFDYLTKKTKRAPKIFRYLGFEWLWRFFRQPTKKSEFINPTKRFKRIFTAIFVFPYKFIVWRFVQPFIYRPNVACLLYKKENNKYKIFLTERKDNPDHWQLPQGGTDGESLEIAGARELREEAGTDRFREVATFKRVYKYQFDKKLGKYQGKRHIGYKGQRQGLFIAEFTGEDSDFEISFWDHANWKWVDAERLVQEVHEYRKSGAEKFLKLFNKVVN